MTLSGYNVVASRMLDARPKQQLHFDCYSEEFKARVNKWLIEFFGYYDEVKDAIVVDGTVYVSTRVYAELRKEFVK